MFNDLQSTVPTVQRLKSYTEREFSIHYPAKPGDILSELAVEFREWVRRQPRDMRYRWSDYENCAIAQFAKTKGEFFGDECSCFRALHNEPSVFASAANSLTFGELADRLDQYV